MRALVLAAAVAAGLTAALGGTAAAALIAYEPIPSTYPPGPLVGNGPAFGLSAVWLADPGVAVVPAGLSSSLALALPSTGGAVAGGINFQAPLTNTIAPAPFGREFWSSYLVYHGAPNVETYMGLSASGAPFGAPASVAYGVQLGHYGIFQGAAFTPAPTAYTPAGSTDLLVMHWTAGGATWHVDLFVNPTSFTAPDLSMNVAPVTYGTMVNLNETGFSSDEFRLGDTEGDVAAAGAVGVGPEPTPDGVELSVVPSPSHGVSRIGFSVPHQARVRISVVDVAGRTVATLADGVFEAGRHEATWNARAGAAHTPAGLYFVRFDSLGRTTTRKVILTP
jgi:hypothetical protein